MLKECRQALRITTDAYDGELCSLMTAAARDLEIAGVVLPGTVAFTEENDAWQDAGTLTDALVLRAILTYVRAHFGSPRDYEQLKESYNTQKVQLMHATGYTDYGEDEPNGTEDLDGAEGGEGA